MDTTITNKGTSGYSLEGMQGIIGGYGNSIYYSSIELESNIVSAINQNKTLSNNPSTYNVPQTYKGSDFIITPEGNLYTILGESGSFTLQLIGNIIIAKELEQNTEHTPPASIKIQTPTATSTYTSPFLNTYNRVANVDGTKSCLYRHITDSNRLVFGGIKFIFDNSTQIYETNTSKTFVCSRIVNDVNFKDAKLVFLFKSGYPCEINIKGQGNDSGNRDLNSGFVIVDFRYVYYQGVNDSSYDGLRYQNYSDPFDASTGTLNKALTILGSEIVDAYLEYCYKDKNYRVKVEYV